MVHAVRGLLAAGCVRQVVVAAPLAEMGTTRQALQASKVDAVVVAGGRDRTESVRAALDAASRELPQIAIVLVHDAARALAPAGLIRAVTAAVAAGAPAVVPVLPVADTVKRVDVEGTVIATVDRADLRAVQTPQGFRADVLREAYRVAEASTTDDAGLVERIGVPVHTVAGHPHAMKITTRFDLAVAEAVLAGEEARQ